MLDEAVITRHQDDHVHQLLSQSLVVSWEEQRVLLGLLHTDQRVAAQTLLYRANIPLIIKVAMDVGRRWFRRDKIPTDVLHDSIQSLSFRLLRIADQCDPNRSRLQTLFVHNAFSDIYIDVYRHRSVASVPQRLSRLPESRRCFENNSAVAMEVSAMVEDDSVRITSVDTEDEWDNLRAVTSQLSLNNLELLQVAFGIVTEYSSEQLRSVSKSTLLRMRRSAVIEWSSLLSHRYGMDEHVLRERLTSSINQLAASRLRLNPATS